MRKIDDRLIQRLTEGDLMPLLDYIKTVPNELRLEVRRQGKAFVYYKKCKALELGVNSYDINQNYFENNKKPSNIKELVLNNPKKYFEIIKSVMDRWLVIHNKKEFETQQAIAYCNQAKNNKYIIIDMEYNFSQEKIDINNRIKPAGFDLLGIERQTGKIIFFEVKRGLVALDGTSGIKTHIEDFEKFLYGENKAIFRKDLIIDIENITTNKNTLGLLDHFDLKEDYSDDDFDFIFVFEPEDCSKDDYWEIFNKEYQMTNSIRNYHTIYVSNNNYILK